ncbi:MULTISPECIES: DUF4440 domain-containing protein [Actinopolyspora]|uniref:Uncharacterized protein n=1 Tax=Actinopolyspora saharensis TaxID=995062 RepID=A0A1H0ZV45_9ACTN|nr:MULTISPECIES: DUF4440 domain-containing protein [Actinopolyspora]SDQ30916.1 hypothetical protein SAMN04489718_1240 [Actinopolyspora saharensis]
MTTEVRPRLNDPAAQAAAEAAVERFAAELQEGLDAGEAETYDGSFAADVMWGSPYGRTLGDVEELLDVHRRLMAAAVAPSSRFEIVRVLAPAAGVAIAHIRRQALEESGFSEMGSE